MAMITMAIPLRMLETTGVLADKVTTHLVIHPALVSSCGDATDYD